MTEISQFTVDVIGDDKKLVSLVFRKEIFGFFFKPTLFITTNKGKVSIL